MRRWWLIGVLALGGCEEQLAPPQLLPAIGTGAPPAPGPAPTQWLECGRIPSSADPPVAAAPVGADALAVMLASKTVLLYRGAEPPIKLRGRVAVGSMPAFSPDGRLLADLTADAIQVRSALDGSSVSKLPLSDRACGNVLRFAPDNQHLLLLGGDFHCAIDLKDGAVTARAPQGLSAVGFQAGQLVGRTGLLSIAVFDAQGNATEESELAVGMESVQAVVLSPAGDRVAYQTSARFALIDRARNAVVAELPANLKPGLPAPLFSLDGAFVLMGEQVLASADGRAVATVQRSVEEPSALSGDGLHLLLRSDDDSPRFMLLDLPTDKPVLTIGGHAQTVLDISVSPDGRRFATTTDSVVTTWNIAPDFSDSSPAWLAQTGLDQYSQFSPDGSLLAVSGATHALFSADGVSLIMPTPTSATSSSCSWSHFAFSPDSRLVAGGGRELFVDVFDTTTHELVTRLPSSDCNSTAAFSPDGAFLVTGALETYRTSNWTRLSPAELSLEPSSFPANDPMSGAIFAPDGRKLVVSHCWPNPGSVGGPTRCNHSLATAEGATLASLPLSAPHPRFSPDGEHLLAGPDVMDLTSKTVGSLGGDVTAAAFAPNGDIIAGTQDGDIVRFCVTQ